MCVCVCVCVSNLNKKMKVKMSRRIVKTNFLEKISSLGKRVPVFTVSDNKKIITDNEEDGMNYHCQGICEA